MRVFDELKQKELTEYNLEKGRLIKDKLFIKHHEEVQEVEEQGHYETIREYPNGGKDVKWVIDIAGIKGQEAYDEYEDIYIYIPYNEEELLKLNLEKYPILVDTYIREKYTLSGELAILRQRDSKPNEFIEYNNFVESCKLRAKKELNLKE